MGDGPLGGDQRCREGNAGDEDHEERESADRACDQGDTEPDRDQPRAQACLRPPLTVGWAGEEGHEHQGEPTQAPGEHGQARHGRAHAEGAEEIEGDELGRRIARDHPQPEEPVLGRGLGHRQHAKPGCARSQEETADHVGDENGKDDEQPGGHDLLQQPGPGQGEKGAEAAERKGRHHQHAVEQALEYGPQALVDRVQRALEEPLSPAGREAPERPQHAKAEAGKDADEHKDAHRALGHHLALEHGTGPGDLGRNLWCRPDKGLDVDADRCKPALEKGMEPSVLRLAGQCHRGGLGSGGSLDPRAHGGIGEKAEKLPDLGRGRLRGGRRRRGRGWLLSRNGRAARKPGNKEESGHAGTAPPSAVRVGQRHRAAP
jgi:hypothetical protein